MIVTRGEVSWAREHPGECIIGIVSEITLQKNGSVDRNSGVLRQYEWDADEDDLVPLDFDFSPPAGALLSSD